MTIEFFDPVGEVQVVEAKPQRVLENIAGKRMGVIFNQHVSSLAFWQALEGEVAASVKPAAVDRVYKANTWAPAPKADVERLLAETDYALVGVGA